MEAIPETCLPVSDIFLTNFVFTKGGSNETSEYLRPILREDKDFFEHASLGGQSILHL